jgi:hypothetical protein
MVQSIRLDRIEAADMDHLAPSDRPQTRFIHSTLTQGSGDFGRMLCCRFSANASPYRGRS